MSRTDRSGGRDGTRAALYVRERLPWPARRRVRAVTGHLAELARGGRIEAHDVYEWESRIPIDSHGEPVSRDPFDAFVRWARERDLGLEPFFDTRECYSPESGERGEWLVLPVMCLAVYEGDELTAVYPHADGDNYRTVEDGLDAIADGPDGESPDEQSTLPTAD